MENNSEKPTAQYIKTEEPQKGMICTWIYCDEGYKGWELVKQVENELDKGE